MRLQTRKRAIGQRGDADTDGCGCFLIIIVIAIVVIFCIKEWSAHDKSQADGDIAVLKIRLSEAEAEATRLRKELGQEYRDYAELARDLARCREEEIKPKTP